MKPNKVPNETTSKRVAKIAGRVFKRLEKCDGAVYADGIPDKLAVFYGDQLHVCTVADLKALAGSCLTQTADKPKVLTPRQALKKLAALPDVVRKEFVIEFKAGKRITKKAGRK